MSAVRRSTADDTIHSRGVAAALFSLDSEEEKFADFQQGRSLAQSVGSLEDLEGSINPVRSGLRDSRPNNLDRSPAVLSCAARGGTTPRSTQRPTPTQRKTAPSTTTASSVPHQVRSGPQLTEEEVFVRGHRLPLIQDDIDAPTTAPSSSMQLVHCAALPTGTTTPGERVVPTYLYSYDPVEGGLVLDSSACNPSSSPIGKSNNPIIDVSRRGKLLPSEAKASGAGPRVSTVRREQDHHNTPLALYHGDHTLVGMSPMGHTALSASQLVVDSLKTTCVVNRHNAVVVNLGLDVVQGSDCSVGSTSSYASKRRVPLHPTEGIVAQYIRMLSSEIKAANAHHMYTIEIRAVSVNANDKVVSLLGDRKTKRERRDRRKERRTARDQAHASRRRDTAAAALGITRELPAPRLPSSLRPPTATPTLEGDTWDDLIDNVTPVDLGTSHRSQAKVLHHLYKKVLGGGAVGGAPRIPRGKGLVNVVGRVRGMTASALGTSQQSGESDWLPDDVLLGRYAEERDAIDDGNSSCFSGDTTGSDTGDDISTSGVGGDVDSVLGGTTYPVSTGPSFHTIVEVTARAAHANSLVPHLGRLLVVDCVGYDLLDGARVTSTLTASDASALRHAPNTLVQVLGALGAQGRGQKQVTVPYRESFLTHLLYHRLSTAHHTSIINNLPLASFGEGGTSAVGLPSITTAHEAMELSRKLVSVRYGPIGKARRLTKAFVHPSPSTTPSSVLVSRVVAAAQYYRQRAYTTAVECDTAVLEATRITDALRMQVQDLETDRLVLMSALTASRAEVQNLEGVVAQAQASGFGGVGVQIDRSTEGDVDVDTPSPEVVRKLQDRVHELEMELAVGATEKDNIRHQYEALVSDMEGVIVRLTTQVADLTTTVHNQSPIPHVEQPSSPSPSHSDPLSSVLVQGLQDAGLVDTHALHRIVSSSNTQSRVDTRGLSVGVALLQLTQQLCEREKAVETLLRRCAVLVGEQGEEPYMKGGLDAPDGMTVSPSELTTRNNNKESRNARQRRGRQEFQSTMHALHVELDTAPMLSGDEWRHLLRKQTLGLRAAVVTDDDTAQYDDSPPLWLCALGSANFPDGRCGVANNTSRVDVLTTPNLFELATRGTPKSFHEYWRSPKPFVQGPIAAPRHRRACKLHRSELQDHSPRYWSRHKATGNASPSRSFSPLGSPFGSMKWAVDNDGGAEPTRNTSPPSGQYSPPPPHGVVSTPNTFHIEPEEPKRYALDEVDRDTTPDPVESAPLPTAHTPTVPLDESTKDSGTPPLAPRPVPPLAKPILRSSDSDTGTPRRGSGTPVSVSFAHDALEVPPLSSAPPLNESQDDWPILPFVSPSDPTQPAAGATVDDMGSPANIATPTSSPKANHPIMLPPSSPAVTDNISTISTDKREKRDKSKSDKTEKKSKADKVDKSEAKQEKSKRDKSDKSESADHKADKPKKEKKDKHSAPSSPLTEEGKKSKKDKSSSS